uniref:Uncharacterized protein n=1 Tax=Piliocolobus tephrosceles TaxID=591936 RepID=A0A8C9IV51_9PRIM
MVSSAHYKYEMSPPQTHLLQCTESPRQGFPSLSQWNGWRAPDVTQSIYFSQKAESQETSSPAGTSAPSFWGNSELGSTGKVAT